jgi:DNA polymerase elongation subunit (family B)
MLTFMITSVEEEPRSFVKVSGTGAPVLYMFGREQGSGASVSVRIEGFEPYFYLMHPSVRTKNQAEDLVSMLRIDRCVVEDVRAEHSRGSVFTYVTEPAPPFKLKFATTGDYFEARKRFDDRKDYVYEERGVSIPLRFMVDRGVVPFGWARLEDGAYTEELVASAACEKCFVARAADLLKGLVPLSGDTGSPTPADGALADTVGAYRTVWFDIECVSHNKAFPTAENAETIMISALCVVNGQAAPQRHCIFHRRAAHRRNDESVPPPEVQPDFVECAGEAQLLEAFAQLVCDFGADLVAGYNTRGFDMPFLFGRADKLECEASGCRFKSLLSRLRRYSAKIEATKFQSSAYGKRETFAVEYYGRADYDLLEILRREVKLSTYTLNAVSEEFLEDHKADLHYSMIPKLYDGSPEDRAYLAAYCLKDTLLPYLIDKKLQMQYRMIEFARVCGVDMVTLLQRGQQIRIVSQLLRKGRVDGFLLPLKRAVTGYKPAGYDGALVFDPVVGYHTEPVMVMDFASLYPSIMVAYNICYSTYIPPSRLREFTPDMYDVSPMGHAFLKRSVRQGVLPQMLELLLGLRGKAKNAAAAATDAVVKVVQDARQYALKLSANSIYGFTGVAVIMGGFVPCFEASESVTAYGRESLQRVANYIADKYPDSVRVYGDSVDGRTPMLILIGHPSSPNRHLHVMCVEDLESLFPGGAWRDFGDGKEQIDCAAVPLYALTESGWTPVRRVIRHRLAPDKRMRCVVTRAGFVECTEDHSLVTGGGTAIKPTDVETNETELMTLSPAEMREAVISAAESGGSEQSGGLRTDEQVKAVVRALQGGGGWNAMFQCTGRSGRPILPSWILTETTLPQKEYVFQSLAASGISMGDDGYTWNMDELYKEAPELHMTWWMLGAVFLRKNVAFHGNAMLTMERWNVSPAEQAAADVSGVGVCVSNNVVPRGGGENSLREFVYDLETENHHFSTYGLVVHNTDSIFVKRAGVRTMADAWECMIKLAAEITATLFGDRPPMKLAPEKIFEVLDMISKKHYAGYKFESPKAVTGKLAFTGVEVARRDNCSLVSETLHAAVKKLMVDKDREGAMQIIKECVRRIYLNQVELSGYVVTKSLTCEPSEYTNPQAHANLVERMRARDPGSAPQVGDRVSYVIVNRGATLMSDSAEDPLEVIDKGLSVDRTYYIENQLRGPVERIFTPPFGEEGVRSIFSGDHTRKTVSKPPPKSSPMAGFFAVQKRCSECRSPCGSAAMCETCVARKGGSDVVGAEQRAQAREAHDAAKLAFDTVYASCQRCQHTTGPVHCFQRDCVQLYERKEKEVKYQRAVQGLRDIEDLA